MILNLERRQTLGATYDSNHPDPNEAWWWSSGAALAIKWSILVGIFLIFIIWFVGGYYHAQRRMKRGLPPLAYHRWLLPRSQRARFEPHLQQPRNQFSFYRQDGYGMNPYPPPPPAYNPDHAPPPTYQPPEGGSKVKPAQDYTAPPPVGESSRTGVAEPVELHHTGPPNPFR